MLTLFPKSVTFIFLAAIFFSINLPAGWYPRGSRPEAYEMGIDRSGYNSPHAATIKSIRDSIDGFGTLMQTAMADKYAGKRIKMSGYVKTEKAEGASLWLRVDGAPDTTSLQDSVKQISYGMDNMDSRLIKGTTDWQRYELVIDVPANAAMLAFGGNLHGTGQMWFDALSFDIVDNTTPVTSTIQFPAGGSKFNMARSVFNESKKRRQAQPANLDFEE